MKVMWKAACAAVLLIAATTIEIGCGETYRPIAVPLPVTTGNPSGFETEVVLSCCLDPTSTNAVSAVPSSVITGINVSGDTNAGNKVMGNIVGNGTSVVDPSSAPLAFDFSRTTVFSANTATDSVTQVSISPSTAGFSATNTSITLEKGSAPIGMSFQYFGATYTKDYVVNSGTNTTTCPGTGSLGAIAQGSAQVTYVCVGPAPALAWIYRDQTKVFVPDSNGTVYVVSASMNKVPNTNIHLPAGAGPIKAAQSSDGDYIYVLNSAGSISIIDGQAEAVVNTVTPSSNPSCGALCSSPLIDIAQDPNFNDTSKNTQVNHVWLLHANGTVSVYDGTTPGQLTWITSLSTGANPTNLALMRDGTEAYVGLAGTAQIVAIDTSKLAQNGITTNATTQVTLDVIAGGFSHKNVSQTIADKGGNLHTVLVEQTTPLVSYVAVSRGGSSAGQSKAYATHTTSTTYYCYDENVNPTACTNPDPLDQTGSFLVPGCSDNGINSAGLYSMTCGGLFNGTAVVAAAANGTTPINTFVNTVLAPAKVTDCPTGNPATGEYDGQKNCPAMTPVLVLGRS
jgi:hypothetical protein